MSRFKTAKMSKEFIEKGKNKDLVTTAKTQEEQLYYFTKSKLQDNSITQKYLDQFANRNFETSDYFINYAKSVLKIDNFMAFYRYLRFPLPSSRIISNRIEPQLRRVFFSEDSDFKYVVNGKDESDFIDLIDPKKFNDDILTNLLYYHNSILVTLLDSTEVNKPYRKYIDIGNVRSIEVEDEVITKIAFDWTIEIDGKPTKGNYYIDKDKYSFYYDSNNQVLESPHDLGHCPAHFISSELINRDNEIVYKSIFTYIREKIEEYVFFKTLQKMTEPNGAIPIVNKLDSDTDDTKTSADVLDGDMAVEESMSSQKATNLSHVIPKGDGTMQAGTVNYIPRVEKEDGSIDMSVVTNYLQFHFMPVASLKYIDERITSLENTIVTTLIGDIEVGIDVAKNEMQIGKSLITLQNTLISLSGEISRIRKLSDTDMLSLRYGSSAVQLVHINYGNDFFLESQKSLLEDLEKAPNNIERKSTIDRINRNRYKNNIDQLARVRILYDLMPYVHDKDFNKAIEQQLVDDITKLYQLRFTYWISQFEATYGNIVEFYISIEATNEEKIFLINELIIKIITDENINNSNNKD